jgi:hypothetical protein
VLDSDCQCLRCGVSLPLRMREHAEIDGPVACLMLDNGIALLGANVPRRPQ